MQNQTPAPNARPKLTIMYFTKIALEQLKGKIPVILLILALLALPAAAVNAYSSGNLLSEVSRLYTRYDLTSPEGAQGFMLALQDAGVFSSFADIALWFISQLLTCAVIIAGAVFVYEAVNKDRTFEEVKARLPVTLLKRSPWVLLISIFMSFLMSTLTTYITYLALLLAAILGGAAGLILSAVIFLILLWLATAFINLFAINMRTAVAVNRARLLFSVTYISTILRGRYKKAWPVYIAALGCRFILTLLLAGCAYLIMPLEGGSGYITLFGFYFISLIIDGLFSAFYAINFFKLEITGQKELIKLQAALVKKYKEAMRRAGHTPPSGNPFSSRSTQPPAQNQKPDGSAPEQKPGQEQEQSPAPEQNASSASVQGQEQSPAPRQSAPSNPGQEQASASFSPEQKQGPIPGQSPAPEQNASSASVQGQEQSPGSQNQDGPAGRKDI